MHNQNVVIALTTRDNDYQAEQSASATEVASRLGVKIDVIYADNNAVNQCQQLVEIIQDKAQRPDAILVEPVGTPMYQVAKAAVAAGIGWGILNREADYIPELRWAGPGVCGESRPRRSRADSRQTTGSLRHGRQHSLYRRPFHQQRRESPYQGDAFDQAQQG